jgi:hypothetical protein
MALQILATQPQQIFFDQHQFDGKRSKAVSIKTGLSWNDFQDHCHVERRAAQRYKGWIPQFSKSDRQLRMVLALGAWKYANGGRVPMPPGLENNLAELKRITNRKFNEWGLRSLDGLSVAEQEMLRRHVFCTERAGGWLELHVTAAYLSWRLGYASPQVATELWLTAPCVRLILYRMTKIARSLGYETFRPGTWMGKSNIRQPHMTKLPPGPELLMLHENPYWTAGRLAKRYKVKKSTVQKSILAAKRELR